MLRPVLLASLFVLPFAPFASAQTATSLQGTYVVAPEVSVAAPAQQTPAIIERSLVEAPNRPVYAAAPRVRNAQVVPGVSLRMESDTRIETVSADRNVAEVRIESGRANIAVFHPEPGVQILVDLPGGQTALVKDGLYTFNATTDTVHVLDGEAQAFPGNREGDGIRLKDNRMYAFGSGDAHAQMFEPTAANTDLLPGDFAGSEEAFGSRGYGYGGRDFLYAGGPYYAGGFAPYYGWGGAYGWGYPYGYGWGYGFSVGVGVGFGYGRGYFGGYREGFGGFRGGYGGFRGGFGRGGFRR